MRFLPYGCRHIKLVKFQRFLSMLALQTLLIFFLRQQNEAFTLYILGHLLHLL
eukprot:c56772_g1_i1 orf=109-267(-)